MSKCKKALDMACKTPLFSNPVSMALYPTCPKRKLAINWRAGIFRCERSGSFLSTCLYLYVW